MKDVSLAAAAAGQCTSCLELFSQYSTVIVGGDPKPRRKPASHGLMRVPRGPSNVPQSLRSSVGVIEITRKPAINSSNIYVLQLGVPSTHSWRAAVDVIRTPDLPKASHRQQQSHVSEKMYLVVSVYFVHALGGK
jgi:hypothetical protein